ncbi:MAG: hypothetical protein R3E11_01255 [Sphingobium sp.]|nr:hypothetical protein [Sphingobium sp.]MCP5400178.1 hypothetical protein [Sphingomonas sp.]
MRYTCSPANPAGAAIAAVLALAPISAMAQVAEPAATPPDTAVTTQAPAATQPATVEPVASPATVAPAASPTIAEPSAPVGGMPGVNSAVPPVNSGVAPTVFAPQQPVVQPVPATPAQPEADNTSVAAPASAPEKIVTQQAAKPASQPKALVAEKQTAVQQAPAAPIMKEADESVPADPAMAVPEEQIAEAPQAVMTPSATAREQALENRSSDGAEWALGLGALALIGGAGLFAITRRRRDTAVQNTDAVIETSRQHVITPEAYEEPEAYEPVYVEPEIAPQPTQSAFAHWDGDPADVIGRREAMIAAAQTADNPFLTRKNRLRRVNFMLRQEGLSESADAVQGVTVAAPQAGIEPVRSAQRDTQVTYRFGGNAPRKPVFRPKFS